MSQVHVRRVRCCVLLGILAGCGGKSPTAPSGSPPPPAPTPAPSTVYIDPTAFRQATGSLGKPTIVDFNELPTPPAHETSDEWITFDGNHYAGIGFTFASPSSYALYIAPVLGWNPSNSLSIGHFPFDADSLVVVLSQPCIAASFQLVDNGTFASSESVEFFDRSGQSIHKTGMPENFEIRRAFVGLVSTDKAIGKIVITEDGNDSDDVNYDDFTCFK